MADFFVASYGNDAWSGQLPDPNPTNTDGPFATFQRAQTAVRECKACNSGPVTVLARGGTYYTGSPIVFTPEDSGTTDGPVTYAAYRDEEPVLSGGVRLDLDWQPYKDGIMKADLSHVPAFQSTAEGQKPKIDFDQLFVNGVRKHRARYPSYDPDNPLKTGKGHIHTQVERGSVPGELKFPKEVLAGRNWAHPEEAILNGIMSTPVGNTIWRLQSMDPERGTVLLGSGGWHWNSNIFGRASGAPGSLGPFFIENVFEELDTPGEWYLDTRESALYYMPEQSEDMATAVVEAACLRQVVEFRGTQAEPVRHITLSGFKVTHTNTVYLEPWTAPSMGDWTIHRSGAVFLQGAEDCAVENCYFYATGGNALFMNAFNHRNTVSGCTFEQMGESAVCLVGILQERIGTNMPFPDENVISNNHIHHCGQYGKQTAGVFLSSCQRNVVSHNEIHHLPRAAVCINDGTWGGHVIEYNRLYETCLETVDHGPFNAWGRSRHWCYNQSHGPEFPSHAAGSVRDDVFFTTEIRYNYVEDHEWGIDLDDGVFDYHIHHNLCVGCPIKFREGDMRIAENNIIVDSGHSIVFNMGYEYTSDRFVRNIISLRAEKEHDHNYGVSKQGKRGVFYHAIDPPMRGPLAEEIDYNLFWSDTGGFLAFFSDGESGGLGERTDAPNRGLTLDEWRALGYDKHSVFADPLFTAPEDGDYRVKPGSPALELGFENFAMDKFGLLPGFPRK